MLRAENTRLRELGALEIEQLKVMREDELLAQREQEKELASLQDGNEELCARLEQVESASRREAKKLANYKASSQAVITENRELVARNEVLVQQLQAAHEAARAGADAAESAQRPEPVASHGPSATPHKERRFCCLRRCAIRAGAELSTELIVVAQKGEVLLVTEECVNARGASAPRKGGDGARGGLASFVVRRLPQPRGSVPFPHGPVASQASADCGAHGDG